MRFRIPSILLKKTTSTNDVAMNITVEDKYFAVISDCQIKGKGRFRERKWYSEERSGLFLSILINSPHDISAEGLCYITRISALSVIMALYDITSNLEGFRIKEPNDIYFLDKKISGVLAESQTKGNSIVKLVSGMGVNIIRPDKLPEDIIDKAVYLNDIIKVCDFENVRNILIHKIIDSFFSLLELVILKKYTSVDEKFRSFMI